MKKKIFAVSLAAVMALGSLTACGAPKPPVNNDPATTPTTTSEDVAYTSENSTAAPSDLTAPTETVLPKMTPGCLYMLKGGVVVVSLALTGNRAGGEEFNYTKPAVDKIRNIFELNEYIEIYLNAKDTDKIKVYAFKQIPNPDAYNNYDYSKEDLPNLVATGDLVKPEEEGGSWGSFYIGPENEPGYYDLIFVCDGKPVAAMTVKLFKEGELESKTDAELISLRNSV